MPPLSTRELLLRGRLKTLARRGVGSLEDLIAALSDPDWRVRRNALRILDHVKDSGADSQIVGLLRDENEDVRKWAAHALGCDRCKPGATDGFDPVPELMRVAERDPFESVRRSAVVCLAWNRPADLRIAAFLADLAETVRDPMIRRHAQDGCVRHLALTGGAG